ncbi:hypothetical protein [uncultured Clostridium sp.]|uniref:hypothetical protein n=1 Tax=uncultured Clostridium sp. TaxID=59620 RepID=UPI0026127270|nr:hypothetical protein [uncultured Clostridium sp.]
MDKLVNLLKSSDLLYSNPLKATEKPIISKVNVENSDIMNNFLINNSIDTESTQK